MSKNGATRRRRSVKVEESDQGTASPKSRRRKKGDTIRASQSGRVSLTSEVPATRRRRRKSSNVEEKMDESPVPDLHLPPPDQPPLSPTRRKRSLNDSGYHGGTTSRSQLSSSSLQIARSQESLSGARSDVETPRHDMTLDMLLSSDSQSRSTASSDDESDELLLEPTVALSRSPAMPLRSSPLKTSNGRQRLYSSLGRQLLHVCCCWFFFFFEHFHAFFRRSPLNCLVATIGFDFLVGLMSCRHCAANTPGKKNYSRNRAKVITPLLRPFCLALNLPTLLLRRASGTFCFFINFCIFFTTKQNWRCSSQAPNARRGPLSTFSPRSRGCHPFSKWSCPAPSGWTTTTKWTRTPSNWYGCASDAWPRGR